MLGEGDDGNEWVMGKSALLIELRNGKVGLLGTCLPANIAKVVETFFALAFCATGLSSLSMLCVYSVAVCSSLLGCLAFPAV